MVKRAIGTSRGRQIALKRKHGAFREGSSEAGEPSAQLNSSTRAFPVRAIGTHKKDPPRWSCESGEQLGGLIWLRAAQLAFMLNPQCQGVLLQECLLFRTGITHYGDSSHPSRSMGGLRFCEDRCAFAGPAMRDTQKKMLEWIETIVTAYNGTGAALELLVNYSRENSGQIYVQPTGCFSNIIECAFTFESRFAVFDFGQVEMQVEYAKPETWCGCSIVFD